MSDHGDRRTGSHAADNYLQPGDKLEGRYRILRLFARGGMSELYEAVNEHTEEIVVIKCLPRRLADRPDLVARFKEERRIYSKLRHPNIVRVLDAGNIADGSIYLVMEKLEGKSLRALIRGGTKLNALHAIDIVNQLCEGLCFAHAKGIWHRDVKPDNVLIGENTGHVWLLDFGLAKLNTPAGLASQELPAMGTVGYMAPEHAQKRFAMDHRADIYAVGVTLYEMIAGLNPFDPDGEGTNVEVMAAHQHAEPRPLHELVPGVPEQISAIVSKCLAKKPEDRYAEMTELWTDLLAESRRLTESGHPLAEVFMQPSDILPSLRPKMVRALEKVVEARVEVQDAAERQLTVELPVHFTPPRAVLPFQPTAPAPAHQRGSMERTSLLPVQAPPPSAPDPTAPASRTMRGKGFTERMLPLPAQAPQSSSQPSSSARVPTPSETQGTWQIPSLERTKPSPVRTMHTTPLEPIPPLARPSVPRRLLLLAPTIGVVLAVVIVTLGAALRSAWEGQAAPTASPAPPIAVPAPEPVPSAEAAASAVAGVPVPNASARESEAPAKEMPPAAASPAAPAPAGAAARPMRAPAPKPPATAAPPPAEQKAIFLKKNKH